jgi:hypothetical protein
MEPAVGRNLLRFETMLMVTQRNRFSQSVAFRGHTVPFFSTSYSSLFSNLISLGTCAGRAEAAMISEALAQYEKEHEFARQILLPEEDRLTRLPWQGGYRWFRSANEPPPTPPKKPVRRRRQLPPWSVAESAAMSPRGCRHETGLFSL